MGNHYILGKLIYDGYYGWSVQPSKVIVAASLEEAQAVAKDCGGLEVWDVPVPFLAPTTAPAAPDKG